MAAGSPRGHDPPLLPGTLRTEFIKDEIEVKGPKTSPDAQGSPMAQSSLLCSPLLVRHRARRRCRLIRKTSAAIIGLIGCFKLHRVDSCRSRRRSQQRAIETPTTGGPSPSRQSCGPLNSHPISRFPAPRAGPVKLQKRTPSPDTVYRSFRQWIEVMKETLGPLDEGPASALRHLSQPASAKQQGFLPENDIRRSSATSKEVRAKHLTLNTIYDLDKDHLLSSKHIDSLLAQKQKDLDDLVKVNQALHVELNWQRQKAKHSDNMVKMYEQRFSEVAFGKQTGIGLPTMDMPPLKPNAHSPPLLPDANSAALGQEVG
jgi:hypothetical protein